MPENLNTLSVGMVQMHSVLDPAANLQACLDYARQAEALGVELLVFPESASSRSDDAGIVPVAEALSEGFVDGLRLALRDSDLTVVVGVTEHTGERPYNTLVALHRGEIVAEYRKIHLYDAASAKESDVILPGDGPISTFVTHGFRIGMMTCYDIRFPELARLLAEDGADVIAVPTSWVRGPFKEEHWETLVRSRAIENTAYVVGSAQTGGTRIGRSTVITPNGVAQAAMGVEEGLTVTVLERSRIEATRLTFPLLQQRRLFIDRTSLNEPARASIG